MQERYNFCEWDEETFKLPDEYLLDENSDLAEALNVFYSAGGYDFFNVMEPMLASGDNRHSGSGEKRQFWSTENSYLQFE